MRTDLIKESFRGKWNRPDLAERIEEEGITITLSPGYLEVPDKIIEKWVVVKDGNPVAEFDTSSEAHAFGVENAPVIILDRVTYIKTTTYSTKIDK